MDIWVRWNRQAKSCSYEGCGEVIAKNHPVVVGRLKRRGGGWIRTRQFWWHPGCWLIQAMEHLNSIPEEERIPKRGRKPVTLDPDERKARLALLRRHAYLTYRQRDYTRSGDLEKVLEIEIMKQELIPLIERTGPVPKRWVVG